MPKMGNFLKKAAKLPQRWGSAPKPRWPPSAGASS